MKRLLFGIMIGFIAAGILGVATLILAQDRMTGETKSEPLIVLGGLKLKQDASPEAAEKLLKEQLLPSMKDIEGLKVKVLKRMKMPGEQTTDAGAYDYIMMAEMEGIQVFMQLMQNSENDAGLSKFGDLMKEYAGRPYINIYQILGKTEVSKQ
jgi:hypothetical protein